MHITNPNETTEEEKQWGTADRPIKEIKWNHKKKIQKSEKEEKKGTKNR